MNKYNFERKREGNRVAELSRFFMVEGRQIHYKENG